MASEKHYASLSSEPDIALADINGTSMKSCVAIKKDEMTSTAALNQSLSQSTPLIDIDNTRHVYREPEHTLSNKNVKRRSQRKNQNKHTHYLNYENLDSIKYIFRPYRCCILLILPISFSIAMIVVNEIETLTCSDCETLYFDCDYFYQYTCHMNTIECCCSDVDKLLFCQSFKYNSAELHYNTVIMRELRYVLSICEDVSYVIFVGVLLAITIIYVIMEKCLKIPLFTNIRNYDKMFLLSWIFTSIMLTIPLFFYFSSSYLKCSNWNHHHMNDGENILPSSDENNWSIGTTLWMCVGSFCQIWLVAFCGCTFNKGVDFEAKNYNNNYNEQQLDENDDDVENSTNHSIFSQKLHSLRAYFQDNQKKDTNDSTQE